MPIRERLLLTFATLLAYVGVFGGIVGISWGFERVVGLSGGTAILATVAVSLFGTCFAMTFAPGAPRWFRRGW